MPWTLLIKQFGVLGVLTFAFQIAAPLSPFWIKDLGFSPVDIGLVSSAQYLGAAIFALPAGMLADRIRHDLVGIVSFAVLGVALILASLGTSVIALSLPFIVIGMARTPIIAVANKSLFARSDPGRLGTVMAIQTMGMPIGSAVAGVAVPLLAVPMGWAAVCVAVGLVMFIFAVAYPFLGTHSRTIVKKPDSVAGTELDSKRVEGALGSRGILRSRTVIGISVATVALMAAEACVATFLLLYATSTLGLSVIQAGSFLAVMRLAGAVGRLPIGAIGDRHFKGRSGLLLLVLAMLAALSSAGLALLTDKTPMLLMYVAVAFCGFASLGWFSTVQALSLKAGGAKFGGVVNGWTALVSRACSVAGPPLFGMLISGTGDYRVSWLVLAGFVAVVGALAYPFRGGSQALA